MAKDVFSFHDILAAPGIVPFAHRGAGDHAPENTFAAFQAAVDLGYPCLETDIQTSAQGTPYVFHDATLGRLTGETAKIGDLADKDLDSLTINGNHAIPKLSDLFEAFPDALFNLDAKTGPATAPMAHLIQRMNKTSQVCIGSFSDGRIKAVLDILGPDTCHSIGVSNSVRFYLAAQAGLKMRLGAHCVQFPMRQYGVNLVTPKTVAYAHRCGLKMHVWTVNDPQTIRLLFDLGVDGIMTDSCSMLKAEMADKGLWPTDAQHQ